MSTGSRPIMITGGVLLVAGLVFLLQSQEVVGPESSFMYSNPEWYTNGTIIMMAGTGLFLLAVLVHISKRAGAKRG